jgi:hypothetical protein
MGFQQVLAIVANYRTSNRPVWQSFVFLSLKKATFDKKRVTSTRKRGGHVQEHPRTAAKPSAAGKAVVQQDLGMRWTAAIHSI